MFNSSVSFLAEKEVMVTQQGRHNFNIVFLTFILLKNSTANSVKYAATINVIHVTISSYCAVL